VQVLGGDNGIFYDFAIPHAPVATLLRKIPSVVAMVAYWAYLRVAYRFPDGCHRCSVAISSQQRQAVLDGNIPCVVGRFLDQEAGRASFGLQDLRLFLAGIGEIRQKIVQLWHGLNQTFSVMAPCSSLVTTPLRV
jgi:hypothetical protein